MKTEKAFVDGSIEDIINKLDEDYKDDMFNNNLDNTIELPIDEIKNKLEDTIKINIDESGNKYE